MEFQSFRLPLTDVYVVVFNQSHFCFLFYSGHTSPFPQMKCVYSGQALFVIRHCCSDIHAAGRAHRTWYLHN